MTQPKTAKLCLLSVPAEWTGSCRSNGSWLAGRHPHLPPALAGSERIPAKAANRLGPVLSMHVCAWVLGSGGRLDSLLTRHLFHSAISAGVRRVVTGSGTPSSVGLAALLACFRPLERPLISGSILFPSFPPG